MELTPILTKFNENVTNGLVADNGSQVHRQRDVVSTRGILFSQRTQINEELSDLDNLFNNVPINKSQMNGLRVEK